MGLLEGKTALIARKPYLQGFSVFSILSTTLIFR